MQNLVAAQARNPPHLALAAATFPDVKRALLAATLVLATATLAAGDAPRPPLDDAAPVPADSKVGGDCTFNGKKLYGKVKVVEHFADFKVKVVEHFPDLNVQMVEHFPDSCGKWQLVEHFPDFTITYVEHFPDFEIKKVQHFPGRP